MDPAVELRPVEVDGAVVDFVVERVNAEAAAILQAMAQARDGVGLSVSQMGPRCVLGSLLDILRGVAETRQELRLEDVASRSSEDDGTRWDIRIVPSDGSRLSVSWRDVSDRYQRQRDLVAHSRQFDRIVAASPIGIATTDTAGRFTHVNAAYSQAVGRDRDWLLSHSMGDILFPGDAAVFGDVLASLGSGSDRQISMRQTFLGSDGTATTLQHTVGQLWDDGHPAGTFSFIGASGGEPPTTPPQRRSVPSVLIAVEESAGLWGDALAALLARRPEVTVVSPCLVRELGDVLSVPDAVPDVVVGVVASGVRGRNTTADLLSAMRGHPDVGLVVLSAVVDRHVLDLLAERNNSTAFLPVLEIDESSIYHAIRSVIAGATVLDEHAVAGIVDSKRPHSNPLVRRLSERELEVLALMAQGADNHSIADSLCVSVKAVENYVGTVFRKLRLNDEPGVNRRVRATLMYLGV